MIAPRTEAILAPNLIGNAPDWDRIRAIADAHGLQVIEDSCDALGLDAARHADRHPLRHQRHELRPRRTSSPRPAPAAWCCSTTTSSSTGACCSGAGAAAPSRSSTGSKKGDKRFFSDDRRRPRVRQPLHLRRGRLELRAVGAVSAAFGLVQLDKLPEQPRAAPAQLRAARPSTSPRGPTCSCCRARPTSVDTGWHMFPVLIRPESGLRRAEFQQHMERTASTRAWCGPATPLRQPAFEGARAPRARGRSPERRPGHGAGPDPAVEPQPRRRRHRLHLRRPPGASCRSTAAPVGGVVMSGRFAGRRALVTGASRGIGAGHRRAPRGRGRRRRDRRPHPRPSTTTSPAASTRPPTRLARVRQPGRDRRGRPHRRRRPRPHRARGRRSSSAGRSTCSSTTRPRRCTRSRRRCR